MKFRSVLLWILVFALMFSSALPAFAAAQKAEPVLS